MVRQHQASVRRPRRRWILAHEGADLRAKAWKAIVAKMRDDARKHPTGTNAPPARVRFLRRPPLLVRDFIRSAGWVYDPFAVVWLLPPDAINHYQTILTALEAKNVTFVALAEDPENAGCQAMAELAVNAAEIADYAADTWHDIRAELEPMPPVPRAAAANEFAFSRRRTNCETTALATPSPQACDRQEGKEPTQGDSAPVIVAFLGFLFCGLDIRSEANLVENFSPIFEPPKSGKKRQKALVSRCKYLQDDFPKSACAFFGNRYASGKISAPKGENARWKKAFGNLQNVYICKWRDLAGQPMPRGL